MRLWPFLISGVLMGMISCSKTSPGSENFKDSCDRITGFDQSGMRYYVSYDKLGRITNARTEDSKHGYTYTYFDDSIKWVRSFPSGRDSVIYYLGKQKRIVKSKYETVAFVYIYDKNDYLSSTLYLSNLYQSDKKVDTLQYFYEYENGDLSKCYTPNMEVSTRLWYFSYYDSAHQHALGFNSPLLAAGIPIQFDSFLVEKGYFGKEGKHLLKSIAYQKDMAWLSLRYTFDDKERITKINNGLNFTYACP